MLLVSGLLATRRGGMFYLYVHRKALRSSRGFRDWQPAFRALIPTIPFTTGGPREGRRAGGHLQIKKTQMALLPFACVDNVASATHPSCEAATPRRRKRIQCALNVWMETPPVCAVHTVSLSEATKILLCSSSSCWT